MCEFMDRIAPQENELLYNRIAPLYSNVTGDPYALLDNPLLDLLNVKYVLTEQRDPQRRRGRKSTGTKPSASTKIRRSCPGPSSCRRPRSSPRPSSR